jgi:hypothetical protein
MEIKEYLKVRNRAYKKYKKIKKVYCPYLKRNIYFTAKGFWHIMYRSRRTKREIKTQLLRLELLKKAVKLLKITTTLQEYEEVLIGKKHIYFFGFIGIFGKDKIKVIVKRRSKGKYIFWSIIPNWITTSRRDRKFFKGDLEED